MDSLASNDLIGEIFDKWMIGIGVFHLRDVTIGDLRWFGCQLRESNQID